MIPHLFMKAKLITTVASNLHADCANENKDVTAVVATADILAIGAMKGFYEQGVSVPQ